MKKTPTKPRSKRTSNHGDKVPKLELVEDRGVFSVHVGYCFSQGQQAFDYKWYLGGNRERTVLVNICQVVPDPESKKPLPVLSEFTIGIGQIVPFDNGSVAVRILSGTKQDVEFRLYFFVYR